MIDITGLKRPEVLAALYNGASPGGAQSMGWLNWVPDDLPTAEAEHVLAGLPEGEWVDYLGGRCLKVKMEGDTLTSYLYDREYGEGAAQRVVDALRARAVAP